jgi:hypothetical protein
VTGAPGAERVDDQRGEQATDPSESRGARSRRSGRAETLLPANLGWFALLGQTQIIQDLVVAGPAMHEIDAKRAHLGYLFNGAEPLMELSRVSQTRR